MNIEKRGDGTQENQSATPETSTTHSKKPVIIYIMILFIVAFLLMALSFVMHQRSNSEALGQLQNSVNAMQAVQATQEKVIALQDKLSDTEDEMDKLNEDLTAARQELETQQHTMDALLNLYALQQQYSNGNYAACKETLAKMEEAKQAELLPKDAIHDETAPAERYEQLKEAVSAK